MKLNDLLYHPCSIDIIEFKIISVIERESGISYTAKATHNVGACGRVEVLLSLKKDGTLVFIDLVEDSKYSGGLGDFVEGKYYIDKQEARLFYYEQQSILVRSNMEEKRRLYENSKLNYEKVEKILVEIRKDINERKRN